jgi:hypothetical protein
MLSDPASGVRRVFLFYALSSRRSRPLTLRCLQSGLFDSSRTGCWHICLYKPRIVDMHVLFSPKLSAMDLLGPIWVRLKTQG